MFEYTGPTKKCCRCKEIKLPGDFHKNKRKRDGLCGWCKDCERAAKLCVKAKSKAAVEEKQCNQCKEIKSAECFTKDTYTRDGLSQACKLCRAAERKARQKTNPELPETKQCTQCGIVKSQKDFDKRASSPDGLRGQCKLCRRLHGRVLYTMRQAQKTKIPESRLFVGTWDQVEDTVRAMAELQANINHEKKECEKRVMVIKTQAAEVLKPHVVRLAYLHTQIELFIKKTRQTCATICKNFRFGKVRFCHGKLEVMLNSLLAQQRMGLP